MTVGGMAAIIFTTVLGPLVAGLVVNLLAPAVAKRIAKAVFVVAFALLLVGVAPVLFTQWPIMNP